MKKFVAVSLTALVLLASAVFFSQPADAKEVAKCYLTHRSCRVGALQMDAGWVTMTLTLTVCDIALGKCILNGGLE